MTHCDNVRLIKGERNPYALEEERKRREARFNNEQHATRSDRRRARRAPTALGKFLLLMLHPGPTRH